MNRFSVRIEQLAPMHVASVRVVSETPEMDAWQKLAVWAGPKGLLNDLGKHPVFGFNNPAPSSGSKKYGYEFWMRIEPEVLGEGPVEVKDVPGGRFAVYTHDGAPTPEVWKELWEWVQRSEYRWRKSHELEHNRNPLRPVEMAVFDLYLPIEN